MTTKLHSATIVDLFDANKRLVAEGAGVKWPPEYLDEIVRLARIGLETEPISCNLRLPTTNARVLFWSVVYEEWRAGHLTCEGDWWDDVTDGCDNTILHMSETVTHWRDIPGCPSGGSDAGD